MATCSRSGMQPRPRLQVVGTDAGVLVAAASRNRRGAWTPPNSRVLGLLLAAVLQVSACGPRTEIGYIDRDEHQDSGHGANTHVGHSADPRVRRDGAHEPSDEVT